MDEGENMHRIISVAFCLASALLSKFFFGVSLSHTAKRSSPFSTREGQFLSYKSVSTTGVIRWACRFKRPHTPEIEAKVYLFIPRHLFLEMPGLTGERRCPTTSDGGSDR